MFCKHSSAAPADSMENASSWTVSGSKEVMEVPKNLDLRKLGIWNIVQYSPANVPFPSFIFQCHSLLPYYPQCSQKHAPVRFLTRSSRILQGPCKDRILSGSLQDCWWSTVYQDPARISQGSWPGLVRTRWTLRIRQDPVRIYAKILTRVWSTRHLSLAFVPQGCQ